MLTNEKSNLTLRPGDVIVQMHFEKSLRAILFQALLCDGCPVSPCPCQLTLGNNLVPLVLKEIGDLRRLNRSTEHPPSPPQRKTKPQVPCTLYLL